MGSPGRPVGASFLVLVLSQIKVRGILERGSLSDHSCRVDAGHRFDPIWRLRIASLGLVVSGSFRSHCSTSPRGIAGLRANSALWFRLPHSIHNHDLPALRCRCDGCIRAFGHLGPRRSRSELARLSVLSDAPHLALQKKWPQEARPEAISQSDISAICTLSSHPLPFWPHSLRCSDPSSCT
jgi:hypothetical protein